MLEKIYKIDMVKWAAKLRLRSPERRKIISWSSGL
jgi:hypothetical protein